eukprot:1665077-Amphidinium_carterae.1
MLRLFGLSGATRLSTPYDRQWVVEVTFFQLGDAKCCRRPTRKRWKLLSSWPLRLRPHPPTAAAQ